MKQTIVLFFLFISLFSCKSELKSLARNGGVEIKVLHPDGFSDEETADSVRLKLQKRFDIVYAENNPLVTYDELEKCFVIKLPEVKQADLNALVVEAHGRMMIRKSAGWESFLDKVKNDAFLMTNDTLRLIGFDMQYGRSGVASVSDTAKLNAFFSTSRIKSLLLPDDSYSLLWGIPQNEFSHTQIYLYYCQNTPESILLNEAYKKIRIEKDAHYSFMDLHIELKKEYAKPFEQLTRNNVGDILPIILDNTVITAPVLHNYIEGGNMTISGNFTSQDLLVYKALIEAGVIKSKLQIGLITEHPKPEK